jgi:hypothetical protein
MPSDAPPGWDLLATPAKSEPRAFAICTNDIGYFNVAFHRGLMCARKYR